MAARKRFGIIYCLVEENREVVTVSTLFGFRRSQVAMPACSPSLSIICDFMLPNIFVIIYDTAHALATILIVLIVLRDKTALCDLCFVLTETESIQVEQCLKRNKANVTFHMLELYCILEYKYFQGCDDVDEHIQRLLNSFLPLPKRLTCFFVRLLRRLSSRRCHVKSNAFFCRQLFVRT